MVLKYLKAILITMVFVQNSYCSDQNYSYECRKKNSHIIHIVTLKPQKYEITFVKAHDQVFGRETIDSMAKRIGADIAINAGFFEIGDSQDGCQVEH